MAIVIRAKVGAMAIVIPAQAGIQVVLFVLRSS
jgi:hypothetical protein